MQIYLSDLIEAVDALREAHEAFDNYRNLSPEQRGRVAAKTFSAYAQLRAVIITAGVKVDVKGGEARLIAAAPDLLAFAESLAGVDNGDGTITHHVNDDRTYQEIAAALVKKARGE